MSTRSAATKTVVRPTRNNGGAARMTRRQAAAKAILGDLAVDHSNVNSNESSDGKKGDGDGNNELNSHAMKMTAMSLPPKQQQRIVADNRVIPTDMEVDDPFTIPADFDPMNPEMVQMVLEDLEREVRKRQESITLKAQQLCSEQQQAYFVATMKIPKAIRNMKVRDFDKQFGTDILKLLQDIRKDPSGVSGVVASESSRRATDKPPTSTTSSLSVSAPSFARGPMETPSKFGAGSRPAPTPGSIRTVRRGEQMFSSNGSPVDKSETGELIATITKKKRTRAASSGNGDDGDEEARAVLDINVGDGRYLDLAEPGNIDILDDSMKEEALQQLKILQAQISSLVTNLNDK